jgi:uncharacterized membrane protein YvlD (DUF360 family)
LANFFAFLGLILEITGTFLGAIHTLFLQRKIKKGAHVVISMIQCQADLKIVTKAVQRQEEESRRREQLEQGQLEPPNGGGYAAFFPSSNRVSVENCQFTINQSINQTPVVQDINDHEDRAQNVRSILEGMELRYKSLAPPQLINKILEFIDKVHPAGPTIQPVRQDTVITIVDITPIMRPVFAYGNIPLMSMAAGVAALAISTILFSVASELLKAEVWISCVAALVGVMIFSFLPTRLAFPASLSWCTDIGLNDVHSSWILKLFTVRKAS